jgi:hypothetical protein
MGVMDVLLIFLGSKGRGSPLCGERACKWDLPKKSYVP